MAVTGRTAAAAKPAPTINDKIEDELRDAAKRREEDRIRAEAAQIREQRRVEAAKRAARAELAARADGASHALLTASVEFDTLAGMLREKYLTLLDAQELVASIARTTGAEATGVAGETVACAMAIAAKICLSPGEAYMNITPLKSCAAAAETTRAVLMRSFPDHA
jgi:hypothetical protein